MNRDTYASSFVSHQPSILQVLMRKTLKEEPTPPPLPAPSPKPPLAVKKKPWSPARRKTKPMLKDTYDQLYSGVLVCR